MLNLCSAYLDELYKSLFFECPSGDDDLHMSKLLLNAFTIFSCTSRNRHAFESSYMLW